MESGGEGEFFEAKVKVLSEEIKHHVEEEEKANTGYFAQVRDSDLDVKALLEPIQARKEELQAQVKAGGLPTAELTAIDADAS
jgi:hypothetical protein